MSRSRMFQGAPPEESEVQSPRTTIVGGRPPEAQQPSHPVPTGLQTLLRMASVDSAFMGELLQLRSKIGEPSGIELSPSERAILDAAPEDQIAQMVEMLPAPPSGRRNFLRQAAAGVVLLLGGAVTIQTPLANAVEPEQPPSRSETPSRSYGNRPDPPSDDKADENEEPTKGPRSDSPPKRPDNAPRTRGVQGDIPVERPERIGPTKGIGPGMPPRKPPKRRPLPKKPGADNPDQSPSSGPQAKQPRESDKKAADAPPSPSTPAPKKTDKE